MCHKCTMRRPLVTVQQQNKRNKIQVKELQNIIASKSLSFDNTYDELFDSYPLLRKMVYMLPLRVRTSRQSSTTFTTLTLCYTFNLLFSRGQLWFASVCPHTFASIDITLHSSAVM